VSIVGSVKLGMPRPARRNGSSDQYAYRALAIAADGKALFSCDTNGGVTVEPERTSRSHARGQQASATRSLSTDNKSLAAGYGDGAIVGSIRDRRAAPRGR
jgi:hypothetical protein